MSSIIASTWPGETLQWMRADPRMVRIHLKQSKTDQFGKGVDIVLGKTGLDLCPVAAVLGYIATRGNSPGQFFVDSRSRPVLKSSFVQAVRGVIASLGLPQDQFAGHSLSGHGGSHARGRRFNNITVGSVA